MDPTSITSLQQEQNNLIVIFISETPHIRSLPELEIQQTISDPIPMPIKTSAFSEDETWCSEVKMV